MDPELGQLLDRLEQERLAATGEAAGLQVFLQPLLQKEAGRIAKKLGPQHPRTQQLKAREQSNVQLIFALEIEAQQLRIKVPEVADDGALVNGRIVEEDGRGIASLKVRLVDRSGTPTRDT